MAKKFTIEGKNMLYLCEWYDKMKERCGGISPGRNRGVRIRKEKKNILTDGKAGEEGTDG